MKRACRLLWETSQEGSSQTSHQKANIIKKKPTGEWEIKDIKKRQINVNKFTEVNASPMWLLLNTPTQQVFKVCPRECTRNLKRAFLTNRQIHRPWHANERFHSNKRALIFLCGYTVLEELPLKTRLFSFYEMLIDNLSWIYAIGFVTSFSYRWCRYTRIKLNYNLFFHTVTGGQVDEYLVT